MNSPKIKKIIVVSEDGSEEEVKKGTVCKIDEEAGGQHVFVGLEPSDFCDFYEVARSFVEWVGVGIEGGIVILDILAQAMKDKCLNDEDEGGSG